MIAIIDYKAGNIASVQNALKQLGFSFVLTDDIDTINRCSHIILPGQGRAGTAMENLKTKNLIELIKKTTKPFLGICLGMQILADWSQEDNTECLGIIPGQVKLFDTKSLKVPHMGWNSVHFEKDSVLFVDILQDSYFYFVHSFYFEAATEYTLASCNYGQKFAAVVGKGNFFATQFHPEKSGEAGMKMLQNFCRI